MKLETFSLDIDADGIAVATFDVPGRSMNTLTARAIPKSATTAWPSASGSSRRQVRPASAIAIRAVCVMSGRARSPHHRPRCSPTTSPGTRNRRTRRIAKATCRSKPRRHWRDLPRRASLQARVGCGLGLFRPPHTFVDSAAAPPASPSARERVDFVDAHPRAVRASIRVGRLDPLKGVCRGPGGLRGCHG